MAERQGPDACHLRGERALLVQLEESLRQCLNALDELGLSRSAAQLDLALHQLRMDTAERCVPAPRP